MNSGSNIVDIIRDRQRAMRRELDRRNIAMKAVAFDSKIEYGTLLTYFPADQDKVPAQLPASAIYALTGKIPADILSLLLPSNHLIVQVAEGVDYDQISTVCRDFVDTKERCHHPESEAGRDIGPTEDALLSGKVVQLRAA